FVASLSVVLGWRRPGCPSTQQVMRTRFLLAYSRLPRTGHQGGTGVCFAGPAENHAGHRSKGGASGVTAPAGRFSSRHESPARSAGNALPVATAPPARAFIAGSDPSPEPAEAGWPRPPRRHETSARDRRPPAFASVAGRVRERGAPSPAPRGS